MTNSSRSKPVISFKAGAVLVLAASAIALAGCEQHPYPTPAPDDSAPPPAPPSQLMGAPEGASGPPPPPQASSLPVPAYGAPAQPLGRAPCAPDPDATGPNAPTVIICSTPVPNPPEHGRYASGRHRHHAHRHEGYGWAHRHRHWGWSQARPQHATMTHRLHHRLWPHGQAASLSGPPHPQHGHARTAPAAHANALAHHHHHGGAPTAPHVAVVPVAPARAVHPIHAAKPAAPKVKPVAPPAVHPTAPAKPASATSTSVTNTTASNTTGGATTSADRYSALQTALSGLVAQEGRLAAPSHLDAGQTGEVSLTLPADFAQTLQADAAQQGLADAATSVNMTSTLAGEGYAVQPDEPQSQPLTVGQPTVFRWKVTPLANQTTAPLQASLSADLLSQGRSLPLGTLKSSAAARTGGRIVGIGLLAVIAAVVLGWALRRRRPTPTGASRPRANHQNGAA